MIGFSQTVFVLVRHSEKVVDGTKDPVLSTQGRLRSEKLTEMFRTQQIDALYATPFNRTRQTLEPLAILIRQEVLDYDPYAGEAWLKSLIDEHPNQTILIAGHSNTIPQLANLLIGSKIFSQFDDQDYSNLLIIVAEEVGTRKLIKLKF